MIFGHYFQLTQADFEDLRSDQSRQDSILKSENFEDIYEDYYFIGDLWQAIDFLLTGESLPISNNPLHKLIYADKKINDYEPMQTMGPFRYFDLNDISEMVALLERITPDNFIRNYSSASMEDHEIHPHDWHESDENEMKSIVKDCYSGLREFFGVAAEGKHFIVMFIAS
jgi:Domain of unknown function (DUF1877)